jgi:cytochrome P450 family 49 subfamily A
MIIDRHGENWYKFRTKVQQTMLQPRTAKLYVKPIEETANAFVKRARSLRNGNLEVPEDFLNEIHKWSLECEYQLHQYEGTEAALWLLNCLIIC